MPPFRYYGATTVMENLLKRRWSAVILRHVENGLHSPDEICNREPGMSLPMFNERLRTMKRYNLITRVPVRAQAHAQSYRLTSRGRRILQLLTLVEQFEQLEEITIQTNATGRTMIYAQLAAHPLPVESEPEALSGGA